jgi:hypothetical protein
MRPHQRGYALGILTIVGAAVMAIAAGIYHIHRVHAQQNTVLNVKDRGLSCAESCIGEAINRIRDDTEYVEHEIYDVEEECAQAYGVCLDGEGNQIGSYIYYLSKEDPTPPIFDTSVFRIHCVAGDEIAEGSNIWTNPVSIISYVKIPDVMRYVFAFKGDLTLPGGVDLEKASVYGRFVRFTDFANDDGKRINVKRVEYFTDHDPHYTSPEYDVEAIRISEPSPDPKPVKLNAEPVFPTIQSDWLYYRNINGTPSEAKIDLPNSPYGDELVVEDHLVNGGVLEPPSKYLSGGWRNEYHYYTVQGGNVIIGNVKVKGQVIISSLDFPIIINGDIESLNNHGVINDDEDPDVGEWKPTDTPSGEIQYPANFASTAHQLILMAPMIKIAANWCEGDLDKKLTIQAILIAPQGSLTIDTDREPSSGITCRDEVILDNDDRHQLDFKGVMWMNSQPSGLSNFFKKTPAPRTYSYMNTMAENPPPLRHHIEREREYELRSDKYRFIGCEDM